MKHRSTSNLGKFICTLIFSCLFIFATTLSSYAHTVNSYSPNCAAGPQYSVTANMSNNNSSSNYRWQWKNNSGSWICFVNGNNTINGNTYNVTGAIVNGANLTTETITITNPNSGLQGLEMRMVISDGTGIDPCTLPTNNTWTSTTNNFINITGTSCAVNTTDCACTNSAANLLTNASFENGSTGWSVSGGNITTGTGYIICGAANGFLNWSSGTAMAWQQVAAVVGNTYNASAYLGTHTPGISCSPKFYLSFYNSTNTLISRVSANVTTDVDVSPNKPALYSLSAVAPTGTASVRVETSITCNTMKMDAFCLTTTAPCTGKVTGLYFNKLDGGTDLPIVNGSTFTASQLGSLYNLETSNSGTIGSVVYNITGPTPSTNTENTIPYNSPGTGTGAWTGAVGTYNVNLKTYSGSNATGTLCHDTTITFIISSGLSLGSRVWNDANNNGINEATETGLANVTVNLYTDNNNDNYPDTTAAGDEILLATTLTDAAGNYIFNNLNPGNYIVGVVSPAGFMHVASNGGDPDNNINLDNNGIYSINGGETAGWAITLAFGTEPNGSSTNTNYNDTYDFGFYTTTMSPTFCTGTLLTNANGYYGGFEIIPPSQNLGPVSNPNPAGSELTLVFSGNISADKAIIATNGNSIPGGISLPPHSGNWLLLLHPKSNNERLWFKSVAVTPGSTYNFCAWGAGSKATPATMTLQLFMNGVNVGTGTITNAGSWTQVCGSYTVPAGVTTMEISIKDPTAGDGGPSHFVGLDDICFTQVTNLNLGNTVWYDQNNDGIKQTSESGIAGVTVKLYADDNNDNVADGAAIATTTTDLNGVYNFTALGGGNYIVGVTIPAGYAAVTTNGGDPDNNIDNDNNGTNTSVAGEVRSLAITLSAGTEPTTDGDGANGNLTLDFGLKGTGSIGDFVFNDVNGNGLQDAGEVGIVGVTVTLTYPNGTTLTTTTDANGIYNFPNLAPGTTYSVTFITPAGYTATTSNAGANDNIDSDPVGGIVTGVTVSAGTANTTVDAGFYQMVNLGNTVWYDQNNDGTKQATETGIAGATVKLYVDANNDNVADGAAIATITTLADGTYSFSNLAPGNYIVGVSIPTGYAVVTTNGGDPDNNIDNDNNGTNTSVAGEVRSLAITLSAGTEPTTDGDGANGNLTLDFGLKGTGSIGDFVWNDVNRNGIQDAGEVGIANATVTLTYPNGTTAVIITDAAGAYSFENLAPGDYSLAFTTPNSFAATPSNVTGGTASDANDSDPINGVVSNISIAAGEKNNTIDAGFYKLINIYGNVWHDANALADNLVNQTSVVPIPSGIRAYLVDNVTGLVVARANVLSGGTFSFLNVAGNNSYRVILSTVLVSVGQSAPGVVLPTGWSSTGEKLGNASGILPGSDGLPDSKLNVNTQATDIFNANFGIKLKNGDVVIG